MKIADSVMTTFQGDSTGDPKVCGKKLIRQKKFYVLTHNLYMWYILVADLIEDYSLFFILTLW